MRPVPFDHLERALCERQRGIGHAGKQRAQPDQREARGRDGIVAQHDRHAVAAFQAAQIVAHARDVCARELGKCRHHRLFRAPADQ